MVRRLQLAGLGMFIALAIGTTLVAVYRTAKPLQAFTKTIARIGGGDGGIHQRCPNGDRGRWWSWQDFQPKWPKRSTRLLEKEENIVFIEQILNALPSPILVHGGGRIVGINAAFSRLFGVETRVGDELGRLLAEIRLEPKVVERVVRNECFANQEGGCERRDGQTVRIVISQNAFTSHGNSEEGSSHLVTMTDVTWRDTVEAEKDALARELREAQKLEAIGQLAGGIAHEINTPSQYVGDNLEFLASAFDDLLVVARACAAAADALRRHEAFAEEVERLDAAFEAATWTMWSRNCDGDRARARGHPADFPDRLAMKNSRTRARKRRASSTSIVRLKTP